MCKSWSELTARLFVVLLAGAIFVAPVVGAAHAAQHQGAVDSADCGICHWSKNAAAPISVAPALGIIATVEVVNDEPRQPILPLQVSEPQSRGPPTPPV